MADTPVTYPLARIVVAKGQDEPLSAMLLELFDE